MPRPHGHPALSLRIVLRKGSAFGPGKAELLEHIRDTGSIAAAGRSMKMSYSRAWGLVEAMNRDFTAPLVRSAKGGADRGGAVLTALGTEVLLRYRRIQARSASAVAAELLALRRTLR
ncbi:MAG TPA: LysR family transcriptional regulator [Burkholderiales bacterium]|jgi:molybdate transport system regulatory protein